MKIKFEYKGNKNIRNEINKTIIWRKCKRKGEGKYINLYGTVLGRMEIIVISIIKEATNS